MKNSRGEESSLINYLQQYGMYEYMLVINLDEVVKNKIEEEKNVFIRKYQHEMVAKTQAHIAIAKLLAKEEMEHTLARWIQRICGQRESFTVTLNNYSGLPAHTIYLRIQNPDPFRKLSQLLKVFDQFLQSSSCPPVELIYHPYLSFAAGLPQELYFRAMMDYSQETFHESFLAGELLFLKRAHQFERFETINIFRFLPPGNSINKVA